MTHTTPTDTTTVDTTPTYELLDLKVYIDADGRCPPQIREYVSIINSLVMKKIDIIENKRNTDINIINDDIECFMRHLTGLIELQDVIKLQDVI